MRQPPRAGARAPALRRARAARGRGAPAPRARARGRARTSRSGRSPHGRSESARSRQPRARLLGEGSSLQADAAPRAEPRRSTACTAGPSRAAAPSRTARSARARRSLRRSPRPSREAHACARPLRRRRVEVALFEERDVHRRERDLDEVARPLPDEIPGPERMGDPGAEAERSGEAERLSYTNPAASRWPRFGVGRRGGSGTAVPRPARRAPRGVFFSRRSARSPRRPNSCRADRSRRRP